MILVETPHELRAWSDRQRLDGRTIALVPTMGALHDGHIALVREGRRRADVVVVSIFVNPLQFNRTDDFDSYPRPIDGDLEICRAHGVDAVYAPRASAMYPPGFETHVEPGATAEVLEGTHRPGHFRGVATVVTKLFAAARPHVAVFGEKDFQQLAVVRRMSSDLDLGVEVVGVEIAREPDGLALSSRNRRLTPAQRAAATCVPRALEATADAFRRGVHANDTLVAVGRAVVEREPLARFEYLEIVDSCTLAVCDPVTAGATALIAVWFGEVRLIDNCRLDRRSPT